MNILVTGGAGYLGSVLVPILLQDGHDVTVLDLFLHGENSLAGCCAAPHFAIVNGDCRDERILNDLVKKADVIVPLAALVGASACERDAHAAHLTNTHAIRLLRYRLSTEQRLIFPNTNSGYGVGAPDAPCTEDSPLRPLSNYALSKVAAEEEVLRHENAVSFRFATLFGASPRMRTDLMVNDFVLRAVRDGCITLFEPHFRRNFLHVRDAANAFVWAIDHPEMIGIYNVGDSRANMTKLQLAETISHHLPLTISSAGVAKDQDKRDYIVSNAKIEATGWNPVHTLDEGIVELIKLYQGLRVNRYGNA